MTITNEDLERIEKAAKEATPGNWTWADETVLIATDEDGRETAEITDSYGHIGLSDDAQHIETADPSTVLALVAEVRRLRGLAEDPDVIEQAAIGLLTWKEGHRTEWFTVTERECDDYRSCARAALRAALGQEDA